MQKISAKKGLFALSPVVVLLLIYLAGSLVVGDFYKIPISFAFCIASVYAVLVTRGTPFMERVQSFSRGAANHRILYMVWIFILAGIFAHVAGKAGAVDATVKLTLNAIPGNYLPAGIFLASCFISMSIGTSVGTIVALTPVVTSMAAEMECNTAWLVAIVVGGSFFGDNLSFISDTTIAATQTQGCSMRSKFINNISLVLPAAVICLLIYAFSGNGLENHETASVSFAEGVKCVPYLIVIVLALAGVNVLVVLFAGIAVAAGMGLFFCAFGFQEFCAAGYDGIVSMSGLIIVTMLAGGMLELVRVNGGIDYLVQITTSRLHSRRGAESAIALLTALANVCTANNTIAILTVGDISRDMSKRFSISPRRAASLLDTTSCFVQGVLPYGAQLLMAAGLSSLSPVQIIPYLYYPMFIGAAVVLSIVFGRGRKESLVRA